MYILMLRKARQMLQWFANSTARNYYMYMAYNLFGYYYTKLQVSAILLQKQHEHIAVVAAISFFFKYYIKVHLMLSPSIS